MCFHENLTFWPLKVMERSNKKFWWKPYTRPCMRPNHNSVAQIPFEWEPFTFFSLSRPFDPQRSSRGQMSEFFERSPYKVPTYQKWSKTDKNWRNESKKFTIYEKNPFPTPVERRRRKTGYKIFFSHIFIFYLILGVKSIFDHILALRRIFHTLWGLFKGVSILDPSTWHLFTFASLVCKDFSIDQSEASKSGLICIHHFLAY